MTYRVNSKGWHWQVHPVTPGDSVRTEVGRYDAPFAGLRAIRLRLADDLI
jgi:hypothetical protein